MSFTIVLFCVALIHVSLVSSSPAKVLNLPSQFELQIPKNDGTGGITSIKQPDLGSYSSSYFSTDSDGASVVMWAPENGVVTGNGAGPRTELTEPKDYFTFKGTHSMSFTQQVIEANPSQKVCIGQIKGDSFDGLEEFLPANGTYSSAFTLKTQSSSCLIVVELIYRMDTHEVEAHMRDRECNGKTFSVGSFAPGEKIRITFKVVDTDVYVSTNKVSLPAYSYSFWQNKHYGMHFKVGVYDQGSGNDGSKGGKAKLSNLVVSHAK